MYVVGVKAGGDVVEQSDDGDLEPRWKNSLSYRGGHGHRSVKVMIVVRHEENMKTRVQTRCSGSGL